MLPHATSCKAGGRGCRRRTSVSHAPSNGSMTRSLHESKIVNKKPLQDYTSTDFKEQFQVMKREQAEVLIIK